MSVLTLDYSYLPCQFCVGKNHCKKCGADVCEMLMGVPGVREASAEIGKEYKRLHITLENDAAEDAVYDALDAAGVFV